LKQVIERALPETPSSAFAGEAAAVLVFVDLAAGKLDERQLALWLEGNSRASAG
jgi:hypothetical protein